MPIPAKEKFPIPSVVRLSH